MGSIGSDYKTAPSDIIFRVSEPFRRDDPEAFTPRVVSIGPYHADLSTHALIHFDGPQPQPLSPIDELKIAAVQKMADGKSFQDLIDDVAKDMDTIKAHYYRSLKTETMGKDSKDHNKNLAKLFAIDACFVVSILFSLRKEEPTTSQTTETQSPDFLYIYNHRLPRTLRRFIIRDMLLIENQIPLRLLLKVIQAQYHNQAYEILHSILFSLAKSILPIMQENYLEDGQTKEEFIDYGRHLLQCVYTMVTYKKNNRIRKGEQLIAIPSAQELRFSGVKFNAHNKSLANISLESGTLSLPMVNMSDDVEIIFKNLLAYENNTCDKVDVILSYVHFMNSIVDKGDDVGILMHHKVLRGNIGSNEEVPILLKKLCANTTCVFTVTHYDAGKDARSYVDKPMRLLTSSLRRAYFTKPWIIIFIFYGFAIFLTTFITMSYTIALLDKY